MDTLKKHIALKSVQIYRETYGVNEGQYLGLLSFENSFGEVKLNLNPTLSKRILEVVSEEIVVSARSVAETLTANCIDTAVQLENLTK